MPRLIFLKGGAILADNILVMDHITKEFPGVKALDNVNLEVQRGEIHALIGENGAGKSTLMNVLSGQYPHGSYTGTVTYEGEECKFKNLNDSEAKGIVIIHQELALIPLLSIGENMFLGNEIKNKSGSIDWDRTYSEAEKHMAQVGLHESAQTLIKDIGTGKQQLVEIAKAFSKKVKLLILDEPTSSLNDEDAKMLLDLLMEFKKNGLTSIIITHKLNEIIYCADRCTIIRDGTTIETLTKGVDDLSEDRIIKGMVGRSMDDRYPSRKHNISKEVMLEVKDWTVHHPLYSEKIVDDKINCKVHKGEVVGFSGLQGAGRTEYEELRKWFLDKMVNACRAIRDQKEDQSNSAAKKAMLFIRDNYYKDISLDDVSGIVNISPYYFSKIFKEETGENFIEYLTRIRIENAKEFLVQPDISIKEAGIRSGYTDPNYFSRIFKKQTDMTPSEYKIRYGK